MVDLTKPEIVERCCSKCGEMKHPDRIVRNRNICKDCTLASFSHRYNINMLL